MSETGRFGENLKDVRINLYDELNPQRLRGIELGPAGALLAASDVNSLVQLIHALQFPLEVADATVHDFTRNLAGRVNEVRAVYRNGYAHLQRMDRHIYQDLRHLVLDRTVSHSPLFCTVACKQQMLQAGLI
jgi:hypothetical protein